MQLYYLYCQNKLCNTISGCYIYNSLTELDKFVIKFQYYVVGINQILVKEQDFQVTYIYHVKSTSP
jgi:hypothetical protein